MMVELRDVVDELTNWDHGKGLLLHGAAGTFCSGGDLKFMAKVFSPEAGANMSRFMQTTLDRLYDLPMVSVAVLEGVTLGGGSELALSCDFRLAADSAKLGFVQVRMGVAPGWGGGVKLVHAVGRNKALDILTTGKVFRANEALDVGLVQHILPDSGDILEASRSWLQKRVFQDAAVIRALKQVVVNGAKKVDVDSMDIERKCFASVWSGPAHMRATNNRNKHD